MKVINLLLQLPDYASYSEKPVLNWETSKGWVGIWGLDWPNLLANQIAKQFSDITLEVWQPDLRADQVISHQFANGVIQRVFPTQKKKKQWPWQADDCFTIDPITNALRAQPDAILHTHGFFHEKNIALLENKLPNKHLHTLHGTIRLPREDVFKRRKNLFKSIMHQQRHNRLKANINTIDIMTYQNSDKLNQLKSMYKGRLTLQTMGCDFSQWQRLENSEGIKSAYEIPVDKKVLLWVSRLNAHKQIDPFLGVLRKIQQKRNDFIMLIAGHGHPQFVNTLKAKYHDLTTKNIIRFLGYQSSEALKALYSISDLFVLTSISEGASVSVIKALACEVPVFSTNTGHTSEILRKHNSGIILQSHLSKEWEKAISAFLDGKEVRVLNRQIAAEYYDWHNVAKRFRNLYQQLEEGAVL
jgi:glycosyltransferase involved in cell wall biosynthesis